MFPCPLYPPSSRERHIPHGIRPSFDPEDLYRMMFTDRNLFTWLFRVICRFQKRWLQLHERIGARLEDHVSPGCLYVTIRVPVEMSLRVLTAFWIWFCSLIGLISQTFTSHLRHTHTHTLSACVFSRSVFTGSGSVWCCVTPMFRWFIAGIKFRGSVYAKAQFNIWLFINIYCFYIVCIISPWHLHTRSPRYPDSRTLMYAHVPSQSSSLYHILGHQDTGYNQDSDNSGHVFYKYYYQFLIVFIE